MRIDFLGLQAFLGIAEHGSFQQAAAHLNLTQTALSHRMKKFEEDLGLTLLTRTTRQVALTPAGLKFLPVARRIMDELSISIDELRAQGRTRHERIAIGCLPTIAVYYLPMVLREFGGLYPDVAVKICDNSATEIAELVESGAIEFGITMISTHIWDLEFKPLLKEQFHLLCPRGHEFARLKSVNWSQLDGVPLVRVSPQTGNRLLIDDELGRRRESLNWRYEVQHIGTAVSLVLAGVGLTVLPRLAADLARAPGLAAVPLRHPTVSRTLGILSKRGLPMSPPGETLAGLVKRLLTSAR